MKLFIWEGDGVLTDYTDGLIVALADDLGGALAAIKANCDYCDGRFPPNPTRTVELTNSTKPEAWLCWGGG